MAVVRDPEGVQAEEVPDLNGHLSSSVNIMPRLQSGFENGGKKSVQYQLTSSWVKLRGADGFRPGPRGGADPLPQIRSLLPCPIGHQRASSHRAGPDSQKFLQG